MNVENTIALLLCGASLVASAPAQTVSIDVDAAKTMGPLRPVWSFFGHDEPNYTYMKDGKKLLSELAALNLGRAPLERRLSIAGDQQAMDPHVDRRLMNLSG